MLRWSLQRGFVPIPKIVDPDRMAENIDLFGFELSQDQMEALNNLEMNFVTAWDPSEDAEIWFWSSLYLLASKCLLFCCLDICLFWEFQIVSKSYRYRVRCCNSFYSWGSCWTFQNVCLGDCINLNSKAFLLPNSEGSLRSCNIRKTFLHVLASPGFKACTLCPQLHCANKSGSL